MLCYLFCVYISSPLKLEHWSAEYIEHRGARRLFGDMNSFFKVKSQCLVFAHSPVHVVRLGLKRFCRGLSSVARKHSPLLPSARVTCRRERSSFPKSCTGGGSPLPWWFFPIFFISPYRQPFPTITFCIRNQLSDVLSG